MGKQFKKEDKSWCFHCCSQLVLRVHHHLASNIYKVPTMGILGAAGNRRKTAFLLSTSQYPHQLCGECCGVPSCRTKAFTPQVVRNVAADSPKLPPWELPSFFPRLLPCQVICLPKGQPTFPSLWVSSKAQSPYFNQDNSEGPPQSQSSLWDLLRAVKTATSQLNLSLCLTLSLSFIPFQGPLRAPLPAPTIPHSGTINFLYANLPLWRKMQDSSFCFSENDG